MVGRVVVVVSVTESCFEEERGDVSLLHAFACLYFVSEADSALNTVVDGWVVHSVNKMMVIAGSQVPGPSLHACLPFWRMCVDYIV